MIRSQASEAVLNKAWNRVAGRWVEYVWWRRGQPWMQHQAGLAHVIRQQGLGDRVAWGKWCYEELEKEREKAETRRTGREQTLGAQISSCDAVKATNFWRNEKAMNQFPWEEGDD